MRHFTVTSLTLVACLSVICALPSDTEDSWTPEVSSQAIESVSDNNILNRRSYRYEPKERAFSLLNGAYEDKPSMAQVALDPQAVKKKIVEMGARAVPREAYRDNENNEDYNIMEDKGFQDPGFKDYNRMEYYPHAAEMATMWQQKAAMRDIKRSAAAKKNEKYNFEVSKEYKAEPARMTAIEANKKAVNAQIKHLAAVQAWRNLRNGVLNKQFLVNEKANLPSVMAGRHARSQAQADGLMYKSNHEAVAGAAWRDELADGPIYKIYDKPVKRAAWGREIDEAKKAERMLSKLKTLARVQKEKEEEEAIFRKVSRAALSSAYLAAPQAKKAVSNTERDKEAQLQAMNSKFNRLTAASKGGDRLKSALPTDIYKYREQYLVPKEGKVPETKSQAMSKLRGYEANQFKVDPYTAYAGVEFPATARKFEDARKAKKLAQFEKAMDFKGKTLYQIKKLARVQKDKARAPRLMESFHNMDRTVKDEIANVVSKLSYGKITDNELQKAMTGMIRMEATLEKTMAPADKKKMEAEMENFDKATSIYCNWAMDDISRVRKKKGEGLVVAVTTYLSLCAGKKKGEGLVPAVKRYLSLCVGDLQAERAEMSLFKAKQFEKAMNDKGRTVHQINKLARVQKEKEELKAAMAEQWPELKREKEAWEAAEAKAMNAEVNKHLAAVSKPYQNVNAEFEASQNMGSISDPEKYKALTHDVERFAAAKEALTLNVKRLAAANKGSTGFTPIDYVLDKIQEILNLIS